MTKYNKNTMSLQNDRESTAETLEQMQRKTEKAVYELRKRMPSP